jgi:hypothetical protein
VTQEQFIDEIIRKIAKRKWAIYSKKKKKGRRKRLGTFTSKKAAKKREKQINYFKYIGEESMKLTRRQLRLLIEEAKTTVNIDTIEAEIIKTLEAEGGAAGLEPLDAAVQALKNDETDLPPNFNTENHLEKMKPRVKRHAKKDYIEMQGLNELRRFIRESLKTHVFYDKYSLGIDDVPNKTKGHKDIIGHT